MDGIIKQNYEVTKARGLITDKTTPEEFIDKIHEEWEELKEAYYYHLPDSKEVIFEIADIILVCLNFAKHYNINIELLLESKIEINRKRIINS